MKIEKKLNSLFDDGGKYINDKKNIPLYEGL